MFRFIVLVSVGSVRWRNSSSGQKNARFEHTSSIVSSNVAWELDIGVRWFLSVVMLTAGKSRGVGDRRRRNQDKTQKTVKNKHPKQTDANSLTNEGS